MPTYIDVEQIIERQSRRGFQLMLMIWMSITMALEGFDNQVQGYTAPAIIKSWRIAAASFSPVFVAFQAGFMVGVAILGNLGDVFGRRAMIIVGVILFGAFTIAGAYTTDIAALAATRFLAAVFLGGAIPNALALSIEYAPRRRRAVRVGVMYVWYTLGAAAGGFLAARLVPDFGWQSIYHVGGWSALVLAAALFFMLPESAGFLIVRGRDQHQLARTLRRLTPDFEIPSDAILTAAPHTRNSASVFELFKENRTLRTLCLWTACLGSMIALQFITSWMPTIFTDSKVSYSWSVIALGVFQAAGAIGGLIAGWALDRRRGILWLSLIAFVGAPTVMAFSLAIGTKALLLLLVAGAGFCVVGAQTGLNALGGVLYPTSIRSTGSGWAYGVGRIGAILGPILGGVLISLHADVSRIFLIVGLPPLCTASALFVLNWFRPTAAIEIGQIEEAPKTAPASLPRTDAWQFSSGGGK